MTIEQRAILRLIDRALQAEFPLAALDIFKSQPLEVQAVLAASLRRRFERAVRRQEQPIR